MLEKKTVQNALIHVHLALLSQNWLLPTTFLLRTTHVSKLTLVSVPSVSVQFGLPTNPSSWMLSSPLLFAKVSLSFSPRVSKTSPTTPTPLPSRRLLPELFSALKHCSFPHTTSECTRVGYS